MTGIVQAPASLPIAVPAGDDLLLQLSVTQDAVAYDWTGATVTSAILFDSDTPIVTNFTLAELAGGVLTLALTAVQTAALGVGAFRYWLRVTKAAATHTWVAGSLQITKPSLGATSNVTAALAITTAPTATLDIAVGTLSPAALIAANNLSDLTDPAAARTNLALPSFYVQLVPRTVTITDPANTTPDVTNIDRIILSYTGPCSVTFFTGGFDGQQLEVISTNANATIVYSAGANGINLASPFNLLMTTRRRILLGMLVTGSARWVEAGESVGPQIDVFTSSGSWSKPAWAKTVRVIALGCGGGAGSGRRGAAGSVRCGGGGASGGAKNEQSFAASTLTTTVTVTLGTPGAGGAAQTVDDTDGLPGAAGGSTTFGTFLRAAGGLAGLGGTATTGTGAAATPGGFPSGAGGNASASGGVGGNANGAGSAGAPAGAGGGITSANSPSAGGAAFESNDKPTQTSVAGGTVPGGAGTVGTSRTANEALGGCGGGGGAASITGAAGAGGNGGNYGGGGGGGGASLNGNASGAGGTGAPAIIVVITT